MWRARAYTLAARAQVASDQLLEGQAKPSPAPAVIALPDRPRPQPPPLPQQRQTFITEYFGSGKAGCCLRIAGLGGTMPPDGTAVTRSETPSTLAGDGVQGTVSK